ncbi:MAG: hypothetical protein U1F30_02655 [Steroidobacteraceae bacterium]
MTHHRLVALILLAFAAAAASGCARTDPEATAFLERCPKANADFSPKYCQCVYKAARSSLSARQFPLWAAVTLNDEGRQYILKAGFKDDELHALAEQARDIGIGCAL